MGSFLDPDYVRSLSLIRFIC